MDTVSHKFYILLDIKYHCKNVLRDLLLTVDALTQTLLFIKKKKRKEVEKYKTQCCKIYNAWHYTNNKVNVGLTMSCYLFDEEKTRAFVISRTILSFEESFNSFKKLVN